MYTKIHLLFDILVLKLIVIYYIQFASIHNVRQTDRDIHAYLHMGYDRMPYRKAPLNALNI